MNIFFRILVWVMLPASIACQNEPEAKKQSGIEEKATPKPDKQAPDPPKEQIASGPLTYTWVEPEQPFAWKEVETGLWLAEAQSPLRSSYGNSIITVIRIDPKHFNFHMISAKEKGGENKSAPDWAASEGLVACVNAGMFQTDYLTNVGYMKNYDFVNNPRMNKDNCVVAFNPVSEKDPPFKIIDLECDPWEEWKGRYHSYSQGIRMVDCHQENKWSQQKKYWSTVAIGEDLLGRALFLFSRTPYSVHDFIDILQKLPIDLARAMYLEGGPEASIFLSSSAVEVKKMGSFETSFLEHMRNQRFWPIPNMIGVSRK